jgi:hypothetical protein
MESQKNYALLWNITHGIFWMVHAVILHLVDDKAMEISADFSNKRTVRLILGEQFLKEVKIVQ